MTILPPPRVPFEFELTEDWAAWYRDELGWETAPGPPLQLLTGLRFDVLELPSDAGRETLRRAGPTGPVAVAGDRMLLLVAAGAADEVPGLLDWLEWGGVALDLTAVGSGGRVMAPAPRIAAATQGAAVWLRPPGPGCAVEAGLPALSLSTCAIGNGGSGGGAPDLVRIVGTAATECHRARLLRRKTPRTNVQPLAFS